MAPYEKGYFWRSSSGSGPGPVTVQIGSTADDIMVQSVIVTFTNTFSTPPIVVPPTFTG